MNGTSMNRSLSEPYMEGGLVVVVAENDDELAQARQILAPMVTAGASAVVVVSQAFAARLQGPAPEALQALDIGIQPSTHDDAQEGALAFIAEYVRIGKFLNRPARDETDYKLADADAKFDPHVRQTHS